MRVAIVHDWLYVLGGAERVLREMLQCYPQADVFTLFDALDDGDRSSIGFKSAKTSFLQQWPRIAKMHRLYLPLMPLAIEQLDLSKYDLVISSSYAVAKGVITGPDQFHVAYVHSPMRYAWDLQNEYLRRDGSSRLKEVVARALLHRLRIWDFCSSQRPNQMIANSAFVARRIRKAFGRDARVIYPPVDIAPSTANLPRRGHFLSAGRLVGYKNAEAIVEAFKLMPDLKLVIAGSGPEKERLEKIAGPNVTFVGFVADAELRQLMATARALIFAAEEDFGIIPVEAQAEGTPVIALGRGGARETVVADGPWRTGIFFDRPSPEAIAASVNAFVAQETSFSPSACQSNASRFSIERFRTDFKSFVESEMSKAQLTAEAAMARGAPDCERVAEASNPGFNFNHR